MPAPQTPSTQQILEIQEIKDDIVFLRGGGLRAVIMVSGVNIELKSEEEQNVILYAFQNFLNALDYSLQLVVHSRKLNIDGYLVSLEERERQEKNDLLKTQITEYREFVKSFVEMNAIMSKTFYAVVPYEAPVIGIQKKKGGLFSFGKKKSSPAAQQEEQQNFAAHIAQLEQRVEQVNEGLRRAGLRTARLTTEELIELFYNLYNPGEKERSLAIAKDLQA